MKPWRAKVLLLAGAAGLAFAIPAAGQRDRAPESLLPPGFGEPAPQPPPPTETEPPATPENEVEAAPPPPRVSGEGRGISVSDAPVVENSAREDLEALAVQNLPPPVEIPDASRRPTGSVGVLLADNGGLGEDAWGNAHGRLLSVLMGRLDAPLPSRWTSMLLRRALLTRAPAPRMVNQVDWVAERAWLLLRMGEADGARLLVQSVDVDQYTPRMFTVAVQTGLATADPAALCPLVGPGKEASPQPYWPLAEAMCAALQGNASQASQLIDQSRRRLGADNIDLLLAEKVVGAGTNTRRAVTIQWEGVNDLSTWRFGLASATGLEVPDALMNRTGSHVWAWQARAPMVPLQERTGAAMRAAGLGVFSHANLIEIFSLLLDATDPSEAADTVGGRLRPAYVAPGANARVDAMEALWRDQDLGNDRYGRLILTATAAARIPPDEAHAKEAGDLVASMMAAGLDRYAARWGTLVDGLGDDGDRAWSILAVGTPRPSVDMSTGQVEAVAGRLGGHKGRMLAAALAGLGRYGDPTELGVNPTPRSRWSQMLALAAERGQTGTVALLAGAGMQTGSWRGVPPHHLYHALKALRQVGLDYEARMIAAEAMSRL
ncbi:MAG TPA: hypothetical protein VEZ70_02995 [Allosphingosinicella sp.]|nr:hypothetical protein [Allosphingosinicella sp.]